MNWDYDLVIVGGGAAGMSAAQYGARANLKTLLIEQTAPGGQALLIDHLENYPGYLEPRSGYDFAEAMRGQAELFGAEIRTSQVEAVVRHSDHFEVRTDSETIRAATLVAATGAIAAHAAAQYIDELKSRESALAAVAEPVAAF